MQHFFASTRYIACFPPLQAPAFFLEESCVLPTKTKLLTASQTWKTKKIWTYFSEKWANVTFWHSLVKQGTYLLDNFTILLLHLWEFSVQFCCRRFTWLLLTNIFSWEYFFAYVLSWVLCTCLIISLVADLKRNTLFSAYK